MVIFNSYVSLPEGSSIFGACQFVGLDKKIKKTHHGAMGSTGDSNTAGQRNVGNPALAVHPKLVGGFKDVHFQP